MRLLLNSIYLSPFFGLNGHTMGVSGSIELYNIVLLLHPIEHKIECYSWFCYDTTTEKIVSKSQAILLWYMTH